MILLWMWWLIVDSSWRIVNVIPSLYLVLLYCCSTAVVDNKWIVV